MVRLIRESDVQKIIKRPGAMREAISVIEESFCRQAQGEVTAAPRHHIFYPPDTTTLGGRYQHALRILPALVPHANAVGARIFTTLGGAPPRCEIIPLWRFEDMQLIAIIADTQNSLHRVRTAAPCGVASRYLAVTDAATVGIYGSGNHARG